MTLGEGTAGETSALLGEIAQGEFKLLSQRAMLTVTTPLPDMNGLDFVLEELPDLDEHGAIDQRPAHSMCRVQLKATFSSKPTVRVSLSKLDTLVKSPNPSVIAVMQYDRENNCRALFLVHLLDRRLSSALRAQRSHGAKAKRKANEAFWTFTAKDHERVDLNHVALFAKFRAIVGPSTRKYADEKNRQLDTLGYLSEGRHLIKGELEGTAVQIVDALLGL